MDEEDEMWERGLLRVGVVLALAAVRGVSAEEQPGHTHAPGTPPHAHPAAPVRITMEELHRHGGVPPGWRFSVPPGDPRDGREVFVKLECFTCHAVKGERFPAPGKTAEDVGPDLTGMGAHHPREYFAESLVNPNAVIVKGAGYTGEDGLSRMPDYGGVLTVRQLIELVAYLQSLLGEQRGTLEGVTHGGHREHKGRRTPARP
jgi:mono/diheme cytochrome c family protein